MRQKSPLGGGFANGHNADGAGGGDSRQAGEEGPELGEGPEARAGDGEPTISL